MNIFMYADGHIVTDAGNPIERLNLDGLVLFVADPKPGDCLMYNGDMWVNTAPVLYASEGEGAGDTVVLDATYADIAAAVAANKAVYIKSVDASDVTALVPLGTFGGDDDTGYTVTAGEATYTADTATDALVKAAADG